MIIILKKWYKEPRNVQNDSCCGRNALLYVSQVKSLVMKILPDAKLSASHRKGTLTVEGSFIPSGNLLRKALKDGGYEVKDISTEKIEKKPGLFSSLFHALKSA